MLMNTIMYKDKNKELARSTEKYQCHITDMTQKNPQNDVIVHKTLIYVKQNQISLL